MDPFHVVVIADVIFFFQFLNVYEIHTSIDPLHVLSVHRSHLLTVNGNTMDPFHVLVCADVKFFLFFNVYEDNTSMDL